MAAQNNSDRPQWMDDIDKKADTRARRLMNARGRNPNDSIHLDELNSEIDRIKKGLLEVHYSQNPQDKDAYQGTTTQPSSTNTSSQPTQEETLQKVETQAKRAQTILQKIDDKIPEGIPIVTNAIKYKANEERALQTIVSGIDSETGESLNTKERLTRAAQLEAESIKAALESATEVATLGGSTTATEALTTLRGVAGQQGVDLLIDNAPATLRKLAVGVDRFGVADALRTSAQTIEVLAADPDARDVIKQILEGSRSIADLRSIVTNDSRLQEVLADFERQINSIPRFKENSPPDIPPPPVIPPGGNLNPLNQSSFGLLAIRTQPQRIETNRTVAARERTREYRENINQAGTLQLTRADLRRLKELYPGIEFTNEDLTAAIHLGLMGVNAERLAEKARRAEETKLITETEQVYLTKLSRILQVYNEANPELARDLEEVNGIPQVTITRVQEPSVPLTQQPSETGTILFQNLGNRALQPLVKKGSNEASKKVSGEVAKKFAKTAAKEVAKKSASAVGAEAGAAAGSVIPVVGNIIGAIAGWLAGTAMGVVVETLSKRTKDLRDLGGGLMLLAGSVLNIAIGVIMTTVTVLATPIIIALFVVPLFVIFTMFVINTSAWVIPPWYGNAGFPDTDGAIDSAFIEVNKEANPTYSENSGLPLTVTYTVTVAAEQSALSNVVFSDTCLAVQEGGSPACPEIQNITINGESVDNLSFTNSITPLSPVTITYTRLFSDSFADTLIIDTFSTTADAEGLTGETSSDSAIVTIGSPPGPASCPDSGSDITSQFASRIPNGKVNLLSESARNVGECITPTMLIIHWSADGAGGGDSGGNDQLYSTLNGRGLSCQFGTDTDDSLILMPLYEKQTERPSCVGTANGVAYNNFGINIEMSGEWFYGTNGEYTDSLGSRYYNQVDPNEFDITVQTACQIMSQYNLSVGQIFGHYELNPPPDKYDPGAEFLHTSFIPAVTARCGGQ